MEKQLKVNVAPDSTSGHFVEKAKQVICLDERNGAYFVDGDSELTTKNHTTLSMDKSCLIISQQVYNPFSKMFEKSKD